MCSDDVFLYIVMMIASCVGCAVRLLVLKKNHIGIIQHAPTSQLRYLLSCNRDISLSSACVHRFVLCAVLHSFSLFDYYSYLLFRAVYDYSESILSILRILTCNENEILAKSLYVRWDFCIVSSPAIPDR